MLHARVVGHRFGGSGVESWQFGPDDAHVFRCFDPKCDTLSQDPFDHQDDLITDHHLLANFATEDKHGCLLP
jgi:hypothetical protein